MANGSKWNAACVVALKLAVGRKARDFPVKTKAMKCNNCTFKNIILAE